MESIKSQFLYANEIIREFIKKEPKFEERFISLQDGMQFFITQSNLQEKVYVDPLILGYALVDYFTDIQRLKDFHKVEHVNGIKVVSYTAYWLLRRKPIQTKQPSQTGLYVNERYVLAYILQFLSHTHGENPSQNPLGNILSRDSAGLHSFCESLFYFLKYRPLNQFSLELFITSFLAGRIYQETNSDLSGLLGTYIDERSADNG